MPRFLTKLTSALNSENKEMQPWMYEEAKELMSKMLSSQVDFMCFAYLPVLSIIALDLESLQEGNSGSSPWLGMTKTCRQ